jgi:hypothetical protein
MPQVCASGDLKRESIRGNRRENLTTGQTVIERESPASHLPRHSPTLARRHKTSAKFPRRKLPDRGHR